jgi:succinate dehydrogenase/fumarate reductase cytochrome b subunit
LKDSARAPRAILGEELPGGFAGAEADQEVAMYLSSPLTAFVVLFVAWAFGFFVFHFAGGLIHLLLAVAAVSLVVHFVRGRP